MANNNEPINQGKKIDDINPGFGVDDVFVGGSLTGRKFLTYTRDMVKAWILSFRPPNAIVITGIEGNMIDHPDLKYRIVSSIIIDDYTKNTGFSRPPQPENTTLTMDDETVFQPSQTITINLI